MLHIGEFSALTGLTVKALRHDDEQGLLAPARVDETSGRRFYAPRQIRDALTILSLPFHPGRSVGRGSMDSVTDR